MTWSSNDQYKVVADKIVSNEADVVVSVSGGLYINSISENTKVATMADVGEGGGSSADIADFDFQLIPAADEFATAESVITIHNHDMSLVTTRETDEDADISLRAADDVFIIAEGDDVHLEAANDVRISTNTAASTHEWEFSSTGKFRLTTNGYIENQPGTEEAGSGFSIIKLVADDQDETSVIIDGSDIYTDGLDSLIGKVATLGDIGNALLLPETGPFTEDYTLALTDANKVVVMDGTARTLFIPTNLNLPLPIGITFYAYNIGAATFTVAGAEGVTVRNAGTVPQFGQAFLRKRGENEWVMQL